ncbi:MAG: AAA family ATPase, partial [Novosphingobium sp.]
MTAFVVTGTDTGIGKTVFSAALTGALGAHYWKPVQAGLDDGADRD